MLILELYYLGFPRISNGLGTLGFQKMLVTELNLCLGLNPKPAPSLLRHCEKAIHWCPYSDTVQVHAAAYQNGFTHRDCDPESHYCNALHQAVNKRKTIGRVLNVVSCAKLTQTPRVPTQTNLTSPNTLYEPMGCLKSRNGNQVLKTWGCVLHFLHVKTLICDKIALLFQHLCINNIISR